MHCGPGWPPFEFAAAEEYLDRLLYPRVDVERFCYFCYISLIRTIYVRHIGRFDGN